MIPAQAPTITVGGRTLAPGQIILPVEVVVGRDNATAQPNANSLAFSYLGALPPQFVRGAPIDATIRGYVEPGWSDIWTDLWSVEASTPGLLPPPTMEGFAQWEKFWGFSGTGVTGYPEDGGATLVTDFTESTLTPGQGSVWQGEVFNVAGATDRTIRASAGFTGEDEGPYTVTWELLWSATNADCDYFGSDVHALTGATVEFASDLAYVGDQFTVPDDAVYVRLGMRIVPGGVTVGDTWDDAVGTWDEQSTTWDTYPNGA